MSERHNFPQINNTSTKIQLRIHLRFWQLSNSVSILYSPDIRHQKYWSPQPIVEYDNPYNWRRKIVIPLIYVYAPNTILRAEKCKLNIVTKLLGCPKCSWHIHTLQRSRNTYSVYSNYNLRHTRMCPSCLKEMKPRLQSFGELERVTHQVSRHNQHCKLRPVGTIN